MSTIQRAYKTELDLNDQQITASETPPAEAERF
jgi:hypothetical protein